MKLSTRLIWEGIDIQRSPWRTKHNGIAFQLTASCAPDMEKPGWCATYILIRGPHTNWTTKTQHFDSITDDVIWVQDALSWAEDLILTPMEHLARSLSEPE